MLLVQQDLKEIEDRKQGENLQLAPYETSKVAYINQPKLSRDNKYSKRFKNLVIRVLHFLVEEGIALTDIYYLTRL